MEAISYINNSIRNKNLRTYNGIPPTFELVDSVVKKSGIKKLETFEISFGIPIKTLIQYRAGTRGLPPNYWHIFYEFDSLKRTHKFRNKKSNAKATNVVPKSSYNLLNELSEKFSR